MAPFNNTSALWGLDSEDVESLRKLMNAIMHRLAGVASDVAAELDNLETREFHAMLFLTQNARTNELLLRMITRFASARYRNSKTVREAARELDILVTEAVLFPHMRPERELIMAERFFNQIIASGSATWGVGADEEYGEIEPDTDGEDKDNNELKTPRKKIQNSYLGGTCAKRARMGVSWDDDNASNDEDFVDSFEDEEFASLSLEDAKSPTKGTKLAKEKFTAKRKHGERCIPDPSINRDCAVVGPPDLSKLSVTFQTERQEPKNSGSFVPSDPVTYVYQCSVDWNDKQSVDKLNSWRYQLLKRNIGQKRESRPAWTIAEQNKVIELVDAHLNSSSTAGRYSKIKWKEIERDFNQHFQNQYHRKGEMTAETAYNTRGEDRIAKSRKLMADRLHLSRSAGAIDNQFNHFTHPTACKLVADARKADKEYDEAHESEQAKAKGNGDPPSKNGKPKHPIEEFMKHETDTEDNCEYKLGDEPEYNGSLEDAIITGQ